jgi:L-arabinokinase
MGREVPGGQAIAYYITAHGYGHGARSCDIIRAINSLRPDVRVIVVSGLPPSFLQNRLRSKSNTFRRGAFDAGMVQLDSIRIDIPATLEKVNALYAHHEELIEQERRFIESHGIEVVVVDIPAIPLEAAAGSNIPGVAVGNFSWDWIYAAYQDQDPRWAMICTDFAAGYCHAELLLRLPFACEMNAFYRVKNIPLVASPGHNRRGEIAETTGAPPDQRWVLLSFTTLDWEERALDRVARIRDYQFFTVHPLTWQRRNIHAIDREVIPFSDVLASVDAVLSKPGFGIVSECIANRKPLIYVERSDFQEYSILETGIKLFLKHVRIPAGRLYRGELAEPLDALWRCPEPQMSLPLGGDLVAAREILEFL